MPESIKLVTTDTLDRFKDDLADVSETGDYEDLENKPIWRGTRAEHDAAEQAGTLPNNAIIGITDEKAPSGGSGSGGSGGGGVQIFEMPDASVDELGNIYQYVGETSDEFTNGYFYKCLHNSALDVYYWQNVLVQGNVAEPPLLSRYSFSSCTDAQFAALVSGADNGNIDLSSIWAIGDERTVHLAAIAANSAGAFTIAMDEQDVEFVIMDFSYNGQTGINAVIGQKNCLNQFARMNASNTSTGSWNGSLMRTDLNNLYYNALPGTFRNCLKTFTVTTAATHNGSSNHTTSDKIALFAEKEIFGATTYSNTIEAAALTQIEYYKTSANRIKYKTDGQAVYYWERSPRSSSSTGFCKVDSDGSASGNNASNARGVAPFGCI